MKSEDLFQIIGGIDDGLIAEAAEVRSRKIVSIPLKIATAAATFALVLMAALLAPRLMSPAEILPSSDLTAEIPSDEGETSSRPATESQPEQTPSKPASSQVDTPSTSAQTPSTKPTTPSNSPAVTPPAKQEGTSSNPPILPPVDDPDEPEWPDDPVTPAEPVMQVYKFVSKYESDTVTGALPKYYGVYETYENADTPAQRVINFFGERFILRYDSTEGSSLMRSDIDLYISEDARFALESGTDRVVRFQAGDRSTVRITEQAVTAENLRKITDRIAEKYIDLSQYSFHMNVQAGGPLRYNCTYQRLIDGVLCDDVLTVTLSSDGYLYSLNAISAGVFDEIEVPKLDLYTCYKIFEAIGYKVNYARYTFVDDKAGLLFDCNIPDGNGGYSYGQTLIITE